MQLHAQGALKMKQKKTRMNVYKEKLLSISFSNSQIYLKSTLEFFPSTHALTFVTDEEGSPFMKRTISILVRVTSGKYYFFYFVRNFPIHSSIHLPYSFNNNY